MLRIGRRPGRPKTSVLVTLTVKVPGGLREAVRHRAIMNGKSVSVLVREFLIEGLRAGEVVSDGS